MEQRNAILHTCGKYARLGHSARYMVAIILVLATGAYGQTVPSNATLAPVPAPTDFNCVPTRLNTCSKKGEVLIFLDSPYGYHCCDCEGKTNKECCPEGVLIGQICHTKLTLYWLIGGTMCRFESKKNNPSKRIFTSANTSLAIVGLPIVLGGLIGACVCCKKCDRKTSKRAAQKCKTWFQALYGHSTSKDDAGRSDVDTAEDDTSSGEDPESGKS